MKAPPAECHHHTHALVFLFEHTREPDDGEPGSDWIGNAQAHRAALRASECASILSAYIRQLGFDARAHSHSASDVDLQRLALAAGLTALEPDGARNPILGTRFGLAVVTTTLELAPDQYLAPGQSTPLLERWMPSHDATRKPAEAFRKRRFVDGPYPFETLRRVDEPTTYIDEINVPRVPKRADMFARSQFGDLGPRAQDGARVGPHPRQKAAPGYSGNQLPFPCLPGKYAHPIRC